MNMKWISTVFNNDSVPSSKIGVVSGIAVGCICIYW